MSLHGRLAPVTGSTSGIGLGIARTLAARGAHIMMNGFRWRSFPQRSKSVPSRRSSVPGTPARLLAHRFRSMAVGWRSKG